MQVLLRVPPLSSSSNVVPAVWGQGPVLPGSCGLCAVTQEHAARWGSCCCQVLRLTAATAMLQPCPPHQGPGCQERLTGSA